MSTKTTSTDVAQASDTYLVIDPSLIVPADDNVRNDVGDITDLAQSIVANGLQQPLRVVGPLTFDDGTEGYQIIAGHRRFAAITQLIADRKWAFGVPCMVTDQLDDSARVAAMIVENLQRTDLNPVEEAHAFFRLTKEFKWKQAELAQRVGRSTQYISDRVALLKLPDVVVEQVRDAQLPLGVAVALSKIGDDAVVLKLTKKGQVVPAQYNIDAEVKVLTMDRLHAQFIKALDENGIPYLDKPAEFDIVRSTELVAELTDPKEMSELAASKLKKVTAYVTRRPWEGKVKVEMRRTLTPAQLEAKVAKDAELRAADDAKYERERAEREQTRRAGLAPEYVAWMDECARLRDEHRALIADRDEAERSVKLSWAEQANAKDVARWAMLNVITDGINAFYACDFFGISVNDLDPDTALAAFCQESAANLVKVVAYGLADFADDGAAVDSLQGYTIKHLGDKPILVLPPEPIKDPVYEADPEFDDSDVDYEDNMAGEFADTDHDYADF